MTKTYKYFQEEPPETDIWQRTVIGTETLYSKDGTNYVEDSAVEEKFTLAQKREELADIERRRENLTTEYDKKVLELIEIGTQLGFTETQVRNAIGA